MKHCASSQLQSLCRWCHIWDKSKTNPNQKNCRYPPRENEHLKLEIFFFTRNERNNWFVPWNSGKDLRFSPSSLDYLKRKFRFTKSSSFSSYQPRKLDRKIEISRVFFVTTREFIYCVLGTQLAKKRVEKYWKFLAGIEWFLELKNNAAASILTPSFDHPDFQKKVKLISIGTPCTKWKIHHVFFFACN